MIKIRVISFQGQPLSHALSHDFDEAGGTIGRAETNQLALPDPQRHISRLQARIVSRGGRYEIINQGANPITVNGHSIGNGSSIPFASGARIEIGAYLMEAVGEAAGAAPAPEQPSREVTLAPEVRAPSPRPVLSPAARVVPPVPPQPPRAPQPPPLAAGAPGRPAAAGAAGAPTPGGPIDDPMHMFETAAKPPAGRDRFEDILSGVTATSAPPAPEPLATPTDDLLAGWTPPPHAPAVEESLVEMLSKPAASSEAMPSIKAELIPEDFDPFANPLAAPPKPAEVNPFDDMESALGERRSTNIDTAYELPRSIEPDTRDPFLGSSLGEPPVEREEEIPLDPMKAFARESVPGPGFLSTPDQVPELHGAYVPPRVEPFAAPAPGAFAAPTAAEKEVFVSWQSQPQPSGAAPRAPSAAPPAQPPPAPAEEDSLLAMFGGKGPSPSADVLGLGIPPTPGEDLMAGLGRPPLREAPPPSVQPAPPPAPPAAPDLGTPPSEGLFTGIGAARPAEPMIARAFAEPEGAVAPARPQPAPSAAKPAPVPPSAAPAAASEALTRAFLAGLGMPNLQLPEGMTPEMMERVGRLLREATQGTLDLLLARATTKREVRADVTMIVSTDNNPLKFSPDVSAALQHLLVPPPGPGFLGPIAAMRDAYDDLRSHQFGFMAGLRAALAGVLKRFDPAILEQRLSQKTMLDSLLPMNRRAKLWDLYIALYRDIAVEAEDDFHALFGREFLRAYREQVERLSQGNS